MAWKKNATLDSACGGSAVLMAQPFVIVYKGVLYGRPDILAFARVHPEIVQLLAESKLCVP